MPKLKVNDQQFALKHIKAEELVARRLELEASLENKRPRLRVAQEAAWIQKLSREVEAEESEVAGINKQIQALNLPYGAVRAIVQELQKAERRK